MGYSLNTFIWAACHYMNWVSLFFVASKNSLTYNWSSNHAKHKQTSTYIHRLTYFKITMTPYGHLCFFNQRELDCLQKNSFSVTTNKTPKFATTGPLLHPAMLSGLSPQRARKWKSVSESCESLLAPTRAMTSTETTWVCWEIIWFREHFQQCISLIRTHFLFIAISVSI